MTKTIIKFKTELKGFQIKRKQIIAQCEKELALVKRLINKDRSLYQEYTTEELAKELTLVKLFGFIHDRISTAINGKKKDKTAALEQMENAYNGLSEFYQHLKQEHLITQTIINAFENDKIKDPINNISKLFAQFKHASLSIEETSRIIGMAISFNSQHAKRNKKHKIQDIDIIHILATYYNPDGTFKYNEDIASFAFLLNELDDMYLNSEEIIYRLFNLKEIDFYSQIVKLLVESNERLSKENISVTQDESTEEKQTMSKETIQALQELRKYYKNGTIIKIPEDMESFYIILSQCGLDENEQKYILDLINKQMNQNNSLTPSRYLTSEQLAVYQNATNLLDTLNHSNGDAEVLKQYLEELQTIIQMLETETNENDIQYLLSDIPNIIVQLQTICDRYAIKDDKTTNKFIFLQNKNGIPYIYDDIDTLEQTSKKAVCALFTKIDTYDKSQFRRVLSNEQLPYSMYEVINNRAHISFIEIDAGIYLIVGADIPRNGYKEFNNRLKSNLATIKQIEETVKNPSTREKILKGHEEFTTTLTDTSENKPNKLVRKAHN